MHILKKNNKTLTIQWTYDRREGNQDANINQDIICITKVTNFIIKSIMKPT